MPYLSLASLWWLRRQLERWSVQAEFQYAHSFRSSIAISDPEKVRVHQALRESPSSRIIRKAKSFGGTWFVSIRLRDTAYKLRTNGAIPGIRITECKKNTASRMQRSHKKAWANDSYKNKTGGAVTKTSQMSTMERFVSHPFSSWAPSGHTLTLEHFLFLFFRSSPCSSWHSPSHPSRLSSVFSAWYVL